MRRFFAKNLLFVIGVNVLVKPVWIFAIDRTVQNRVGHEAYGTYQPLLNLCLIFQILLDFGIVNYNSKMISEDPDQLPHKFPGMLSARLLLIFLFAIVVLLTALILGFRSSGVLLMLSGVVLMQAFNYLTMFIRSNVAALHRFRIDGLLSIADRGLMIILCGLLLWLPATSKHFTINTFVTVQVICYGVAALVSLLVLRRLTKLKIRLSLQPDEIKRIIKQSFPYALLIFLMAIYMRSDSLLIERLCGTEGREQAGIYAAAYRPLEAINMFALLVAGILLPLFSRMLARKESVAPIVKLCMNLMFPMSLVAAGISVVYGKEIMQLLYPAAGSYDSQIFGWLIGAMPAYVILYIYSTLLTANGSLKQLHLISVIGIVVNLSLNLWLIPQYKALGAAVTACITMSIVALCFILAAHRQLQLPKNAAWIGAHIVYALIMGAIICASGFLPLSWLIKVMFSLASGILLLFPFRFVSLAALRQLIRP